MICLINIREKDRKPYDEVWLISRYVKSCPSGVKVVSDLAPSMDLLMKYRDWDRSGQWNAQTFRDRYLPQFLNEINENAKAKNLMNDLYRMDKQGKHVALACFCGDESLCHRSIVGGILAYKGVSVCATKDIRSYLEYGKMYDDVVANSSRTVLSDASKGRERIRGNSGNSSGCKGVVLPDGWEKMLSEDEVLDEGLSFVD